MTIKINLIRRIKAEDLLESFLISAVVAILAIRFYLHLAGYPQLGGGGLHIAHMLWGGILMLVTMIMLLIFLNKTAFFWAAILGGIGFGTFIDELGKFITHDNNYFFQPTIALIYVIFVILYLVFRYFENYQKYSQETYLINTLESIKEAILHDLDRNEQTQAKKYLVRSNQVDPIVKAFSQLLQKFEAIPTKKLNPLEKINRKLSKFYKNLVQKNLFSKILIAFFIVQSLATIIYSMWVTTPIEELFLSSSHQLKLAELTFAESGDFIFSLVSSLFVMVGIFKLFKSRLAAYQMFKIATLISIFLTQFFVFYDVQFAALWGFIFNILVLISLDILIEEEKKLPKAPTLI